MKPGQNCLQIIIFLVYFKYILLYNTTIQTIFTRAINFLYYMLQIIVHKYTTRDVVTNTNI